MIVDSFRTAEDDGVVACRAIVRWEDRDQDACEVFIGVRRADADRVGLNPDSFRIPAAVVARHHAENRITGGGPICPVLRDGIENAFGWLARWSRSPALPPVLDLPLGCDHAVASPVERSAAFLSGGVDSLALLAANHAEHPAGDPRRIAVGIVIAGIQQHRWKGETSVSARLEAAREQMAPVGAVAGIDIVPVATNLRALNPSGNFWRYEYQGAALAGIGHHFAPSVSHVSIASTWKISDLDEWGSHPLLDPNFSSHSLQVWHQLAHLGRFGKMELLATRPDLLDHVNVCNSSSRGDRNCSTCEKCLRTMLALEALGLLKDSPAFEKSELFPGDLQQIRITDRGLEGEYVELIEPLRRAGRKDLVAVIQRNIRVGRLRRFTPTMMRESALRVMPPDARARLRRFVSRRRTATASPS